MLEKKQFSRYLLYALGETILVVMGILIALWVNRTNEESKLIEKTQQSAQMVLEQLQKDIEEINTIMKDWDEESRVADTILRLTPKDETIPRTCTNCPLLITGASIPTVTDRIPKILSERDLYEGDLLSVLTDIEYHYLEGIKMVEFHENAVIEFTKETLKHWQNSYDWFSDLSGRGTCPDDCLDYFYNSADYRNRVAYYELILLDSYYYEIETFNERNATFAKQLEQELQKQQ